MNRLCAPRKILGALLAGALLFTGCCEPGFAQQATDPAALQEQLRNLQRQLDQLNQQMQALKQQQAQPAPAAAAAAPPPPVAKALPPPEPKFEKFLKGFYGTVDVSLDYTTKGMEGMTAYHIENGGLGPGLDYNNPKGGPVGAVGWQPALSTNKSQIGWRGAHAIAGSDTNFIVQVETSLAITASPGLKTSYTQQSNVVNGAIGLGDTFAGFEKAGWGRLIFGTFYSPYKKSTDRLNPFSGMLGDYAVVMGNTGGDNRVEFGTRLEHSIAYNSPKFGGMFSFDLLASPGQNRTYDNVVQSSGSPDCSGGNEPGSGNLLLNCDDGGFDDAFSVDVKFENGPIYATAAYEWHHNVNRNSDGIGSNHPIYGYLDSINSPLLDFATFAALSAEFPTSFG